MAEKKTTISVTCSEKERAELAHRQKMRGFDSIAAYTRHLLIMGTLVEEAMAGHRLTPETFANAFFMVAERIMGVEVNKILAEGTAQELKEWKQLGPEARQLIVGQIARPIPGKN